MICCPNAVDYTMHTESQYISATTFSLGTILSIFFFIGSILNEISENKCATQCNHVISISKLCAGRWRSAHTHTHAPLKLIATQAYCAHKKLPD